MAMLVYWRIPTCVLRRSFCIRMSRMWHIRVRGISYNIRLVRGPQSPWISWFIPGFPHNHALDHDIHAISYLDPICSHLCYINHDKSPSCTAWSGWSSLSVPWSEQFHGHLMIDSNSYLTSYIYIYTHTYMLDYMYIYIYIFTCIYVYIYTHWIYFRLH